jgi:hypothetical protein
VLTVKTDSGGLRTFIVTYSFIILPKACYMSHPSIALNSLPLIMFAGGSGDSSVGIATDDGLDGQDLNPGRNKIFIFSTTSRPALWHTQSPIQLVPGVISSGIKRPWREAYCSPPSSAEVKNGEAIPPLPHTPYVFMT